MFTTDGLALVDDEVRAAIGAEREGTFLKLDATLTAKWPLGLDNGVTKTGRTCPF